MHRVAWVLPMFLGEHETYFYAAPAEKHRCLFSNLIQGMNAGCSTLYISSGENVDAVRVALRQFGVKTDRLDQMHIVTSHDWFTPNGAFEGKSVVDQYRRLIDDALEKGLAGLYVSGDASDTLDYLSTAGMLEEWITYEHSYGTTFKFPMEAICSYNLEQVKSSPELVLQLIKGHKHTLTHRLDNRIINEQAIRQAVYRQLKNTLGPTTTDTFFDYLDFHDPTQESVQGSENVWAVLESILREGDASLKQRVLTTLYEVIGL